MRPALRARRRRRAACSRTPDEPGYVARLRIFNPDGSEAELSGNGAREAILYLRRNGWTDSGHVLASRRSRARSGRRSPARPPAASTWAARSSRRRHFPGGPPDGQGELSRRRGYALPARHDRQPAVRDPRRGPRRRSTCRRSARRSRTPPIFPNRTNVSFWTRARPRRHPRADLRARRGGDAVLGHRRVGRRRRPRARGAATRRSPSSSTAASSRSTSTSRCTST